MNRSDKMMMCCAHLSETATAPEPSSALLAKSRHRIVKSANPFQQFNCVGKALRLLWHTPGHPVLFNVWILLGCRLVSSYRT